MFCQINLSLFIYSKQYRSSVARATDQCTEGHGFNSHQELKLFLCPMLATF